MEQKGIWLSILDYADYRGISISTIRRYIKASQVKYKKENGKYFIFVTDENYQRKRNSQEKSQLSTKLELEELKRRIRILEEENNDLKMLVQLYEGKPKSSSDMPPALPSEATEIQ